MEAPRLREISGRGTARNMRPKDAHLGELGFDIFLVGGTVHSMKLVMNMFDVNLDRFSFC